jgi:hypothetical protein
VSVAVMRRWEPHDPGRSYLLDVITHYVTYQQTHRTTEPWDHRRTAIAGGLAAVHLSHHPDRHLRTRSATAAAGHAEQPTGAGGS